MHPHTRTQRRDVQRPLLPIPAPSCMRGERESKRRREAVSAATVRGDDAIPLRVPPRPSAGLHTRRPRPHAPTQLRNKHKQYEFGPHSTSPHHNPGTNTTLPNNVGVARLRALRSVAANSHIRVSFLAWVVDPTRERIDTCSDTRYLAWQPVRA
jgi:hypothetical protein